MDGDESQHRFESILRRLYVLSLWPEAFLNPSDNDFKCFIRELQNDIKDEVKDLMGKFDYESAFIGLTDGIKVGRYLRHGHSWGSQIDMKLLVLRSQCANKLERTDLALEDVETALRINPDYLPANVELVKVKYTIAKAEGDTDLIEFERFLQDKIPDRVKETPEVEDIIKDLRGRLSGVRSLVARATPKTADLGWIPDHNKKIAQKAKEVSCRSKEKRRQVKPISDNAEPMFPKTVQRSTLPNIKTKTFSKVSSCKSASSSSKGKLSQKPAKQATRAKVAGSLPSSVVTQKKTPASTKKGNAPSASSSAEKLERIPSFHHRMHYACDICLTRYGGKDLELREGSNNLLVRANDSSHSCKQLKKVVMYCKEKKRWCRVEPMHPALPPNITPSLCKFGEKCRRQGCKFPHITEEVDLWVYMAKYKIDTLRNVMSAGRKSSEMSSSTPSPAQSPSAHRYHCCYCDETYTEPWHLEQHKQTKDHRSKVNSDSEREWKFRSPPWNVQDGNYEECKEHKRGICMFSDSPENNCTKAHSNEELLEWMERHEYRMMKIRKAKTEKLYAFMDDVLMKYNFRTRGAEVIADELPQIKVTCSQDITQALSTEGKQMDSVYRYTWEFTIKTSENKRLKRVCLFYDEHRVHFRLSQPNEQEAQVCPGNLIVEADGKTYRINVIFHSQILGSFNQWVLFDFGSEPYLARKLQVQVMSAEHRETFDLMLEEKHQNVEVWDSSNRKIVRFQEHKISRSQKELMANYKVPSPLCTDDLEELSRDNYKEFMHKMLYLEEKECNEKISKFTTKTQLKCLYTIKIPDSKIELNAQGGTLYGHVDLKRALMDDSETSQIITRSVQIMMLKFSTSETIYEARILNYEELMKQSQDTLYIQLSPTCVREAKLLIGTEYPVHIQLQLNRISFYYMHSTVDNLENMDIVFPPKENSQKLPSLQASDDPYQEQALKFICEHGVDETQTGVGPVLVYGPFGTGKTHTLATAVKRTLESRPESKILICTQSNSAADLYITEHLDKLEEKRRKIIRIYAISRDIKNVSQNVRPYIPVMSDGNIRIPNTQEIKSSHVVITTLSTCHRLVSTKLKGHFTHILIDEAGQALETETLQPLTLATGNTCVVLAGDHIQMSQKVFSKKARFAKFNMSLLERLFHLKVPRVLLPSNYRTSQPILDFISKAFYQGTSTSRKLKAVVNPPPHPKFSHPLVFYTVKGEDQRIGMSYVNHHEVDQIVLNVKDMYENWPEEKFGKLNENSIGIVTPYILQVRQIRKRLQALNLKHIDVGGVQNIQGKQFRVLIISTVRTRNTLNKAQMTKFLSKISPANRPDETYDYGFLSDLRLLNTAFTRAQSLVMVVGDPIALCSVGECSTTWCAYLKECEEKHTLFPLGTSLEEIRQEMGAAFFKPTVSSTAKTSAVPPQYMYSQDSSAKNTASSQFDTQFWQTGDDKPVPDAILKELFIQIDKDESRRTRSTPDGSVSTDEKEDATSEKEVSRSSRKKGFKFRMVEEKDHIALKIDYKSPRDDFQDESDSVDGLKNDMHDERERQAFDRQVATNPDKFKICSFHCEKTGETYAIPLNEDSSKKISIISKKKGGRALNLDEVIVEVLDKNDESGFVESRRKKTYGQVVCIKKRAPKPSLFMMKTVCKLDEHIFNQMVPVDRTLPKFFVISHQETNKTKINTNTSPDFTTVSIYRFNRAKDDCQFEEYVEVSRRDRSHKLFVVQYVKWYPDAPYPIGVVTEELPQGDDVETCLRLLKLMHGVKEEWKPAIKDEVNKMFPVNWQIPDFEIESREDKRGLTVFTIDPPEARDLDDALSVDMVDNNYQVGIHIADVSYFVSKDSVVDTEAKIRATTFYPSFADPINMLPPELSNRLCSLLPDEDRLTISVFVTLNKRGSVVGDVKIARSVIRSQLRLTYDEAEQIINTPNNDKNKCNVIIQEKVLTLNQLAQERRRSRLGVGRFAFSHNSEEEELLHPLAHSLVEEMMLLANEEVARFIVEMYPDFAPLRRQLPPSKEEVKDWLSKHGKDLPNSLDLQSRPLPLRGQNEVPNDMHMTKEKMNKLRDLVTSESQGKKSQIVDLICNDEHHPQLAVAKANFFIIQETAKYIRSGEHSDDEMRHHTLKMTVYTRFTSPIRRYFDLVVHRTLIAALIKSEVSGVGELKPPYTESVLAEICVHCNNQDLNSRDFEKETRALQFALRLREAPQTLQVFVKGVSDASVELMFPYRRFIPSKARRVKLKLLKPHSKPCIDEDNTRMELTWNERIYELHGSISMLKPTTTMFSLDTETMVVTVPHDQWNEILTGVQEDRLDLIQNAFTIAESKQQLQEQERERERKRRGHHNFPVKEVTCERSDRSNPFSSVNFKRSFEPGDVVQVQLHASIQMGMLMPRIQLFGLTPKLSLCTEHRENAVECFSDTAIHRAAKVESIEKYMDVWRPIVKMVAAYNAVRDGASSVIHSVEINWQRIQQDKQPITFRGIAVLEKNFCIERNLKFRRGDYLCIRYTDLPLAPSTKKRLRMMNKVSAETGQSSEVDQDKLTFVAHAIASDVKEIGKDPDKKCEVHIEMNQCSSPFPDVLLPGSEKVRTCSIEWISKADSDSRLEVAIQSLPKASSIVQNICLRTTPQESNVDCNTRRLFEAGREIKSFKIAGSPFAIPNGPQQAALRLALQQPFTIIQGPPGTGKTVTGAHLAYFFTQMNKQLPDSGRPPQVLYCGPSNKSVDVVAHYLLKLSLPVIRVYNQMMQRQDFPAPGQHGYSTNTAKVDVNLKSISLHHLIRKKTNPYSEKIEAFDEEFKTPGYNIVYEDQIKYKRAVREAEAWELKRYHVVLCTCNEAGSVRIQHNVNAIQCIVDEAGMCNEPETLIPLVQTMLVETTKVGTNPRQVVLIGDHKQLRPIIQEKTAVQLGMEISLLEKYSEKAQMLTIQYRMHASICAFPSNEFYGGKLKTADSVKKRWQHLPIWPGGRDNPMVFCHHVGSEESQSVQTEEGNEQSKANPQEVQHVVRIASVLVNRLHVRPEDLVILAQYRLQKSQIEAEFKKRKGLENIKVSTVITSQGKEWDYVILSTVRSLPRVEIDDRPSKAWKKRNLGFITDENQTNVAITRPKLGLIIIGNKNLLQTHLTWRHLLTHYKTKNAIVDADNFPRHSTRN